MMNMLELMFGLNQGSRNSRQQAEQNSFIYYENEEEGTRLRVVPDTSQTAIAARQNAQRIYGRNNVSPTMGMRGVIEVRDPETGNWTPVVGTNQAVPDMETQLAALDSYRETGIIGPQPINDEVGNGNAGRMRPRAREEEIASAEALAEPATSASRVVNTTNQQANRPRQQIRSIQDSSEALRSSLMDERDRGGNTPLYDVSRAAHEFLMSTAPTSRVVRNSAARNSATTSQMNPRPGYIISSSTT